MGVFPLKTFSLRKIELMPSLGSVGLSAEYCSSKGFR